MDLNVVRRLRKTLRMSQQEFANELELSIASIRSYEAGTKLSDASVEKLKSLAARKMLPDFAMELDGRDFNIRQVFSPGKKVRLPRVPAGKDLGDILHRMLDEVLESGSADAVVAIEAVLQLCRIKAESVTSASKSGRSGAK